MIIINYWQYVSKHYFLSHLLLGAIAAGLSLSSQSTVLDVAIFDYSGQRVTLVATDNTYQVANRRQPGQIQSTFLFSLHSFRWYFGRLYTNVATLLYLVTCHGFNEANAIRAGPHHP